MVDITFTMTAENAQKVVDAICAHYGYQEQLIQDADTMIPNPETRAQFTRRMIKEFIASHVRSYAI